jgi:CheY-like chemotaxis protein
MRSPLRVLVVDDHADTAESLALWLTRRGFETHVALDGARGLAAADTLKPQAVLLDLGLPGMDGYEVARRLRARPTTTRLTLVAVSGLDVQVELGRTQRAGFDHYLVKPVDLDLLERTLQSCAAALPT